MIPKAPHKYTHTNIRTIESNRMPYKGGEPQSFLQQADGFRFPRLGETIKVQISAIESAEVSFDQ